MSLEEILEQWQKDSIIDKSELGQASLDIPKLHHRFYKMYMQEKLTLAKLRIKIKKLEKQKIEYYTGKLSQEDLQVLGWEPCRLRILKTELHIYLGADEHLSAANFEIEVGDAKVDFLESTLKMISNRTFQVKNAIDWERFKVGN